MSAEIHDTAEADNRLDKVLACYLQAVEEGRPPSRRLLLADNLDLANVLQYFLYDLDFMKRVTYELCFVVPAYIGDFQLLQVIGSGTFGVVIKAQNRKLPDLVAAIKLFRGKKGSAYNEARKAALLDHPNIV